MEGNRYVPVENTNVAQLRTAAGSQTLALRGSESTTSIDSLSHCEQITEAAVLGVSLSYKEESKRFKFHDSETNLVFTHDSDN